MKIKDSKVLVTGGAGFIGSHIVESIIEKEAEIIIYDNFSTGSLENLRNFKNEVEIIKADILDYEKLNEASENVDLISHQAAQLEITKCIEDPIEDLKVNTEGSLNVFNVAKNNKIQKVIYASSACVYGQAQYIPQDENHPTAPNWPYGVSKLAVEKYSKIYSEYYKIPMVGLRYAITYGEREWYGRVLTVFLKRALENKNPVVWEGEQIRDFVYVKDIVELHNLCIENDNLKNEIFNASTSKGISIKELANLIINTLNLKGEPIYENVLEGQSSKELNGRKRLPLELKKMVLDNKKAKKMLNWTPNIELEEGLVKEFEWLRQNQDRWKKMSY